MLKDRFLLASMLMMTMCVLTLSYCCFYLLFARSSGRVLIHVGPIKVTMGVFATVMLTFCHLVNGVTWAMVFNHCGGHSSRFCEENRGENNSRVVENDE
jgi:hypothetical protein